MISWSTALKTPRMVPIWVSVAPWDLSNTGRIRGSMTSISVNTRSAPSSHANTPKSAPCVYSSVPARATTGAAGEEGGVGGTKEG